MVEIRFQPKALDQHHHVRAPEDVCCPGVGSIIARPFMQRTERLEQHFCCKSRSHSFRDAVKKVESRKTAAFVGIQRGDSRENKLEALVLEAKQFVKPLPYYSRAPFWRLARNCEQVLVNRFKIPLL